MKCPVCRYINDPENDLCNKCFSDLRPAKQELGLKVTEPAAVYEELLARKVKIVSRKKQPGPRKFSAVFAALRFFRKSGDQKPAEFSEVNSSESVNPSEFRAEIQNTDIPDESSQPDKKPQGLKLAKRQKEQVEALLRRRQDSRDLRTAEREMPEKVCSLIIPDLPALDAEVNLLFAEAGRDLVQARESHPAVTAIDSTHFLGASSQSAISVLFDLASEELAQPDKVRQFVDPLSVPKVWSIKSSELEKAVSTFHKEHLIYEEAQANLDPRPTFSGTKPAPWLRLLAWSVDCAICFLSAAILALLMQLTTTPLLAGLLLGEFAPGLTEIISVLLYSLAFFLPVELLCLPVLRSLYGQTAGEKLFSLRLVDLDNKSPGFLQSLLWNISSSVTLITLGLSEIFQLRSFSREKLCSAKILRS